MFGDRLAVAAAYADLLAGPGTERGLIGPRELPRLWDRHILNCAVLEQLIGLGESVVDIGSGAGLPGIPLAIARPDLHITLVEPMQRRVDFLHEALARLDLPTVHVERARASDVVPNARFDVVTARAVAKLDKLASWSRPLVRSGGRLLALKGASVDDELQAVVRALRKSGATSWTVEKVGEGVVDPATVVAVVNFGRGGGPRGRKS